MTHSAAVMIATLLTDEDLRKVIQGAIGTYGVTVLAREARCSLQGDSLVGARNQLLGLEDPQFKDGV